MKSKEINFDTYVARKFLDSKTHKHYISVLEGHATINDEFLIKFTKGLMRWAKVNKATHYSHMFTTLDNTLKQKYCALYENKLGKTKVLLTPNTLYKTEVDGSSFPNGNTRTCANAKAFAVWNIYVPIRLITCGEMRVVTISAVLTSCSGDSLDYILPLLRSSNYLNKYATKLTNLLGYECNSVTSYAGLEQEYFVFDKDKYNKCDDLKYCNRLIFEDGIKFPKSSYFNSPSPKMLEFFDAVSTALSKLGINVETQHHEVAPNQYELVCKYKDVVNACMDNLIVYNVVSSIAKDKNMVFNTFEKPMKFCSGSGKHFNWSLLTDTNINVFDKKYNLLYKLFTCAVISAIDKYSYLLNVCVTSRGNELRLGGHEAPVPVVTVGIEEGDIDFIKIANYKCDINMSSFAPISMEARDRNRTSPFAYTGNKWEFRMPGANTSPAFCATVINTIVANTLSDYYNKLRDSEDVNADVIKLVQDELSAHNKIVFSGDNYHTNWKTESKARGLFVPKSAVDTYAMLTNDKTTKLFSKSNVLNSKELKILCGVMTSAYINEITNEAKLINSKVDEWLPSVAKLIDKKESNKLTINVNKLNKYLTEGINAENVAKVSVVLTKIVDLVKIFVATSKVNINKITTEDLLED